MAAPCEAKHAIAPEQLVDKSDVIVLATATAYYRAPVEGRAGRGSLRPPANDGDEDVTATVAFRVDSVIKGSWTGAPVFNLAGTLVPEGREAAPDDVVPRRYARGKACIAMTYVRGGQYLFLFKRMDEGLTAEWAPLSPANERVRGESDPWLGWVRARAASAADVKTSGPRVESH